MALVVERFNDGIEQVLSCSVRPEPRELHRGAVSGINGEPAQSGFTEGAKRMRAVNKRRKAREELGSVPMCVDDGRAICN